jgi:hypothetical protein
MVAVDDIGAFGAAALLDPARFAGRAVELAGDEVSMAEAARLLADAAGFPIRFRRMGADEAERAMCPNWRAMFRWFDAGGYTVDIPGLTDWWGSGMTTLASLTSSVGWTVHLRGGTCGRSAISDGGPTPITAEGDATRARISAG